MDMAVARKWGGMGQHNKLSLLISDPQERGPSTYHQLGPIGGCTAVGK